MTRELVEAWYRDRAHIKFPERIELCLGLFPNPEAFRPKGLIVRRPGQRQRIGAPVRFDRHGDLVVGDAVEIPVVVFGQGLDDVDRVKIFGKKLALDDAHARVPLV